jgi:small conductance mechanosensitive channel
MVPFQDSPNTDPDLVDACGTNPGRFCEWVWEQTENETLAQLADWFVDTPLRLILTFVIALLANWFVRRLVLRGTKHIIDPPSMVAKPLEGLGVQSVSDPRKSSRATTLGSAWAGAASITIWTVAVFYMLSILGINLGPLIAGAGIAGIAIGFGAQSLVKDCINGMFMLAEDQFGIGDVIRLDDGAGVAGVVEKMSLRATVMRAVDGTVWHVPNGDILRVGNLSQLWSVALVDVEVAYDADLAKVKSVIQATADAVCARPEFADDVLEPPSILGVESLGVNGVSLRITVKTKPGVNAPLARALREAVKAAFDTEGVQVPYSAQRGWVRMPAPPPADDPPR